MCEQINTRQTFISILCCNKNTCVNMLDIQLWSQLAVIHKGIKFNNFNTRYIFTSMNDLSKTCIDFKNTENLHGRLYTFYTLSSMFLTIFFIGQHHLKYRTFIKCIKAKDTIKLSEYFHWPVPWVWSKEGPVPRVSVSAFWRIQSNWSSTTCFQVHRPCSKSQSYWDGAAPKRKVIIYAGMCIHSITQR